MRRYTVYGATLATEVEFPELREAESATAPSEARWTFGTSMALPPMRAPRLLGAELIYRDVHARLFAHETGHRISVDDTGEFDLSADLRRVTWEERAGSWPDFVRAHLVGRVLATAMYLEGWLPLHGSAVETRDGVIAFLAPKGCGKSTLALALVQAGARLVTDDALPVEPGDVVRAWPGVHSVRVHDDALAAIGLTTTVLGTHERKVVVADLPAGRLMAAPAPLGAIYLLDPAPEGIAREALPAMHAALGVVAHVKVGRMLGRDAAGVMLERSAAIVRRVPVHRLRTPRDLRQLADTAATVLAWHGGAP